MNALPTVYLWWNTTDICREEKHKNYKLRRHLLGYQLEPYSSTYHQPKGTINKLKDNFDSHWVAYTCPCKPDSWRGGNGAPPANASPKLVTLHTSKIGIDSLIKRSEAELIAHPHPHPLFATYTT